MCVKKNERAPAAEAVSGPNPKPTHALFIIAIRADSDGSFLLAQS